ncbi:MAG TPA: energy-coupling factor transporter transmembrane component T [Solirubrobacteraceae bacterium]|jgi:energy-coupling factor transport system permease protein
MSALAGATSIAYRRRASPLHAARGTIAACYGLSIAIAALLLNNPILLGALLFSVLAAAAAAGVLRPLLLAMRISGPIVLLTCIVVNAFVSHYGLTVLARLGNWGVLGQVDPTLEAIVYGAVVGLRLLIVTFSCLLIVCAANPQDLLRACRRVSPRSALTAAIATRLVSVLAADARRLADAQRCRPEANPSRQRARLAILRATLTGAFDRSLDIAAMLEMRGYAAAGRALPAGKEASRHDLAFALGALGTLSLSLVLALSGAAAFDAYPLIHIDTGAPVIVGATLLGALALLPFLDRRGIQ